MLSSQGRCLNLGEVSSADVFKVKRRLLSRIAAWFVALRMEVAARSTPGPQSGAWPSASFATHQDKLRVASYMILLRDVLCHLCNDMFCHPVLTSLVDDDLWSNLTPALLRMFISFSASQVR